MLSHNIISSIHSEALSLFPSKCCLTTSLHQSKSPNYLSLIPFPFLETFYRQYTELDALFCIGGRIPFPIHSFISGSDITPFETVHRGTLTDIEAIDQFRAFSILPICNLTSSDPTARLK
jgi:hypothetical protein